MAIGNGGAEGGQTAGAIVLGVASRVAELSEQVMSLSDTKLIPIKTAKIKGTGTDNKEPPEQPMPEYFAILRDYLRKIETNLSEISGNIDSVEI